MNDDNGRPGGRAAPGAQSALACAAPGCPWVGSSGETGRYLCLAHGGADGNQWHAITKRTIELEWFAAFIADVQRMSNRPLKGEQSWIAYAVQFWENTDKTMQPDGAEARSPSLYLYRMFGELRAMALGKDRPGVHVPQGQWPDFNRLAAPAARTAA